MNKNKYEIVMDLCDELCDLESKLNNLDEFMKSDEFNKLSERHQNLLSDQCDIMFDYVRVLGRRIEDLT